MNYCSIDNGKRKNCSDIDVLDDNIAKLPVHKMQGCIFETSVQQLHKK